VQEPSLVGKTAFFLSFPYVCPEPVLAKRSFLYINGAKMPFSAGILTFCYTAMMPHYNFNIRILVDENWCVSYARRPRLLKHLAHCAKATTTATCLLACLPACLAGWLAGCLLVCLPAWLACLCGSN
jgi:hypothetical protein